MSNVSCEFYVFLKIIQIFSFDGVGFTSAAPTKCYHQWGGLANYKGLAFTTGSDYNSGCYKKSELYNFDTNQWTDAPNYPFARLVKKIYLYHRLIISFKSNQ